MMWRKRKTEEQVCNVAASWERRDFDMKKVPDGI